MILAESAIEDAIGGGEIAIDPPITDEQIQPASLDLRLGGKLYEPSTDTVYDDNPLTIHPGTFYLGHTRDDVALSPDLAAQVAGRSTLGRRGVVVHKTAGWIDPGFRGDITLEIYNFGAEPVDLSPGDRVAQLVFYQVAGRTDGYDGQYAGQRGPTPAGELE